MTGLRRENQIRSPDPREIIRRVRGRRQGMEGMVVDEPTERGFIGVVVACLGTRRISWVGEAGHVRGAIFGLATNARRGLH